MSGAAKKGFTMISDHEASQTEAPADASQAALTQWNTTMLLLALRAVSQRALTAITNLFTLGLVASAWWLWSSVLTNPTTPQLIALGGYALFCLLVDLVRRRA